MCAAGLASHDGQATVRLKEQRCFWIALGCNPSLVYVTADPSLVNVTAARSNYQVFTFTWSIGPAASNWWDGDSP